MHNISQLESTYTQSASSHVCGLISKYKANCIHQVRFTCKDSK